MDQPRQSEHLGTGAGAGGRHAHRGRGRRRLSAWLAPAVGMAALAGLGALAVLVPAAGAATATVDVATNATYGTILTDAGGFTLYTLGTDHDGMSTCTGSCAQAWPALTVPAGTTPTAGPGVTGTVAAVVQADGSHQVTYDGDPLYTFLSDASPGQVTGNGVAGFAVVKVAPAGSSTTTATTTAPASATSTPPSSSAPTTTAHPAATSPGPSAGPAGSAPAPAAPTAPAAATAGPPTTTAAASGSLAFTGPGPGVWWMALAGTVLVLLSLVLLVGVRVRSRLAVLRSGR